MSDSRGTTSTPSPRIEAAVALLDPRPRERLLEIGCGTGQAIQAIVARQASATIEAIDRSATAVARARIVNKAAIAAGRVRIAQGDIDRAPVEPGGFDRVFAIRVNSFWTHPGVALPQVAASLKPRGELWIIFDEPADKIVGPIIASLDAFGMTHVRTASARGAFAIVGRKASTQ